MHRHRASRRRFRLRVLAAVVLAATVGLGVTAAAQGSGQAVRDATAQAMESPAAPTSSPAPSQRPRLSGAQGSVLPSKPSTPQPTATRPRASTVRIGAAERRVLAVINQARAAAGTGPLTMSAPLVAAAHAHNLAMARGCGLTHQCAGEASFTDRISAQGVQWSFVAENISQGGPVGASETDQTSLAVGLTTDMLAEVAPDDGHRKNIINPTLHKIGIDVHRDATGRVWLTQDFSN